MTYRVGSMRSRPCGMQFKVYTTLYYVLIPVVYCFGFAEECIASLTAFDTTQAELTNVRMGQTKRRQDPLSDCLKAC
jgi:hypothetical protein